MDERERRLALNEAVFRELNERIEEQAATLGSDDHVYEFLCECSNADCALRLELTRAEYERVRADSTHFIVATGHDLPEIESVVARTETYWVVEKANGAAELAEALDRRP